MTQNSRRQGPEADAALIDAAASWYVRLSSGVASTEERASFERWRAAHADHAQAWARFEMLQQALQSGTGTVSAAVATSTLRTARRRLRDRRRFLAGMVAIGATIPALYLLRQHPSLRHTLADLRTGVGEVRLFTLSDGSQLWLNTDSAVDLNFDAHERRLLLRGGEIRIETAPDTAGRPFVVTTPDGSLRPIGTRFSVRRYPDDTSTRLQVSAGTVEVRLRDSNQVQRISAGQSLQFETTRMSAPAPAQDAGDAWADGMLTAERMRLADFLAELSRHRTGLLRCDPAVADLRLTGTFPLADTDRVLTKLAETLPVALHYRTRFWVTVIAR